MGRPFFGVVLAVVIPLQRIDKLQRKTAAVEAGLVACPYFSLFTLIAKQSQDQQSSVPVQTLRNARSALY